MSTTTPDSNPNTTPDAATVLDELNLLPVARLCESADPVYSLKCAERTHAFATRTGNAELAAQALLTVLHARRALGTPDAALLPPARVLVADPALPESDRVQLLLDVAEWELADHHGDIAVATAFDARRRGKLVVDSNGAAWATLQLAVPAIGSQVDPDVLLRVFEEAVDRFALAEHRHGVAIARFHAGLVFSHSGRHREALACFADSHLYAGAHELSLVVAALVHEAIEYARIGDLAEAERSLTHADATVTVFGSAAFGGREIDAMMAFAHGLVAAGLGHPLRAIDYFKRSAAIAGRSNDDSLHARALGEAIAVLARSGNHIDADSFRREHAQLHDRIERRQFGNSWWHAVTRNEFKRARARKRV
jgi:tetratricopeptide (TPR) repeat protein